MYFQRNIRTCAHIKIKFIPTKVKESSPISAHHIPIETVFEWNDVFIILGNNFFYGRNICLDVHIALGSLMPA